MQVRIQHGGIAKPVVERVGADSVVVFTPGGSPVVVALNISGHVYVKTASDPDFMATLGVLGIRTEPVEVSRSEVG